MIFRKSNFGVKIVHILAKYALLSLESHNETKIYLIYRKYRRISKKINKSRLLKLQFSVRNTFPEIILVFDRYQLNMPQFPVQYGQFLIGKYFSQVIIISFIGKFSVYIKRYVCGNSEMMHPVLSDFAFS
jgi:hypothetical protein